MSFLYPSVLWCLFALLIPIIIHLFTFRKFVVIRFSSIKFIDEIKENVNKKKKLKHLLILLSRSLFLFFLIVAFSQPIYRAAKSKSLKAIYMDNSMSQSAEIEEGQNGLSEGIEYVRNIVSKVNIEDRILFITNDTEGKLNLRNNKTSIQDRLTELNLTNNIKSYDKVLDIIERNNISSELFFISDFQKSTMGQISSTANQINLIPINIKESANLYVDTVYIEGPILVDEVISLKVVIRNGGNASSKNVQMKILSQQQLLLTNTLSIEANQELTIEANLDLRSISSKLITIEIGDFPIVFDNKYYLVINEYVRPIVTYIYEGEPNEFVQKVLSNSKYFDFTSNQVSGIDYKRVESSNFIILDNIKVIPQSILNAKLTTDILLIPSNDIDENSYNKLIGRIITLSDDSLSRSLEIHDLNHPFIKNVFNVKKEDAQLPKAKLIYNISGVSDQILKTSFGDPYLSIIRNTNNIYFFGSPLKRTYTDFVVHALFLPIMYRMVQNSIQHDDPLAYRINDRLINVRLDDFDPNSQLRIAGKDKEFIPNFRHRNHSLILELPPNDLLPGFYHVILNNDTIKSFSLNIVREESEMETYTIDELREVASNTANVNLLEVNDVNELKIQMDEKLSGLSIWKYALIISFFFLFSESLLVRFL